MENILASLLVIFVLGGIYSLIRMKIRYSHMEDIRLSGSSQQEGEHLADGVDSLRAEVELLRDEFHKLDERMDFTERLLERPKTEE